MITLYQLPTLIGKTFCVDVGVIAVADCAQKDVLDRLLCALQRPGSNYWSSRIKPVLVVFFPGLDDYGIPASMLEDIKLQAS